MVVKTRANAATKAKIELQLLVIFFCCGGKSNYYFFFGISSFFFSLNTDSISLCGSLPENLWERLKRKEGRLRERKRNPKCKFLSSSQKWRMRRALVIRAVSRLRRKGQKRKTPQIPKLDDRRNRSCVRPMWASHTHPHASLRLHLPLPNPLIRAMCSHLNYFCFLVKKSEINYSFKYIVILVSVTLIIVSSFSSQESLM